METIANEERVNSTYRLPSTTTIAYYVFNGMPRYFVSLLQFLTIQLFFIETESLVDWNQFPQFNISKHNCLIFLILFQLDHKTFQISVTIG